VKKKKGEKKYLILCPRGVAGEKGNEKKGEVRLLLVLNPIREEKGERTLLTPLSNGPKRKNKKEGKSSSSRWTRVRKGKGVHRVTRSPSGREKKKKERW